MNIKKHIPNLFTLANLLCGISAIIYFLGEKENKLNYIEDCGSGYVNYIHTGIALILLAAVFDFLDGFMAKLLKAQSPIGAQLDSLADMVTFGVAPGILVFVICEHVLNNMFLSNLSFMLPVFSALRLAKFNVDIEQTDYFKGIPTPANAIFWLGLILSILNGLQINTYVFGLLIIVMSLLMMSNLKMISLKFKHIQFKGDNIYRFSFLGLALLLIIGGLLLEKFFLTIPLIILLYIFLSIPYHYSKKNKNEF